MSRLFISAGEVSGDVHGAYLAEEILKRYPHMELYGIGGENMKAAGVTLTDDLTEKNSVGLLESLPFIWANIKALNKAARDIRRIKPSAVIFIDNQGFNLSLAKKCRRMGIYSFYYFAPQFWLWGFKKPSSLKGKIDYILATFRKEHLFYKGSGINVDYIGHPILEELRFGDISGLKKDLGLEPGDKRKIIGLLPGSRKQEFDRLFGIFLKTAELLKDKYLFLIPFATEGYYKRFNPLLPPYIKGVSRRGHDVMAVSDLLVMSSGTATLEAAVAETPMVITYKTSKLTEWVARLVVKINHIGMPNILAEKEIVPELIQEDLTADNIISRITEILETEGQYDKVVQELRKIKESLKPENAVSRAAEIIGERISNG